MYYNYGLSRLRIVSIIQLFVGLILFDIGLWGLLAHVLSFALLPAALAFGLASGTPVSVEYIVGLTDGMSK